MHQSSLFDDDPDPPAQRHSPTSVAAAGEIRPVSGRLRQLVLDWLTGQSSDGGTDEEGIAALGLSPSTYRPRRVELVEAGLVIDSGRTRRTYAGRKAVVWVARLPLPGNA